MILLPLRPWSLARVASGAALPDALLVSTLTAFLLVAGWLSFIFGQISEPYPDMGVYLDQVVEAVPFAVVYGLVLTGIPHLAIVGVVLLRIWQKRPRSRARERILLLNHVALFLPIAGFLALTIHASLGDPDFGLLQAKPDWLMSPIVHALGSIPGSVLIVGIYALSAIRAFRGVRHPSI